MGNEQGRSNTYVRNATGKPIRVFYQKDIMKLDQMVISVSSTVGLNVKVGTEGVSGGISGSTTASQKLIFNRYTHYTYIKIPVNDYAKISGEGKLFVSVFVEGSGDEECEDQIALNFPIPSDRSFIVTKNTGIKLQKYGGSLCEGEDGLKYCFIKEHSDL